MQSPKGPTWTQDDIEVIAQRSLDDLPPPAEMIERIGPEPGPEFLTALGRRMYELMQERGGPSDLVDSQ